jgi:hypothetical protein
MRTFPTISDELLTDIEQTFARAAQKPTKVIPQSNVSGVSWDSSVNKWQVRIWKHGKQHTIGRYRLEADAIAAKAKALGLIEIKK